jgi:hypothetical protein
LENISRDEAMTDKEQHKLAKAKAIANEIIKLAEIIAQNATIAFPPKRLFRKKGKWPLKRLKRQHALIAMGIAPFIAKMQVDMIMAQPIPNYVPGGVVPGGIAMVGESGPEMVGGFQNSAIGEMVHVPIQWQNKNNDTTANQHPYPNQQPANPIRPVSGIDKVSDV